MLKPISVIDEKRESKGGSTTVALSFIFPGDKFKGISHCVQDFFGNPKEIEEIKHYGGNLKRETIFETVIQGVPYSVSIRGKNTNSNEGINYNVSITFPENVRDEITPILRKKLEGIMS